MTSEMAVVNERPVKFHSLRFTYLYWEKLVWTGTSEARYARMPYACVATYQPEPGEAICVGVSRVSEHDQFRRVVGRDIAAGRARKQEAMNATLPWAVRLKAGGSAYVEFEEALKRARSARPITYTQAVNVLFDFCRESGIPFVPYSSDMSKKELLKRRE